MLDELRRGYALRVAISNFVVDWPKILSLFNREDEHLELSIVELSNASLVSSTESFPNCFLRQMDMQSVTQTGDGRIIEAIFEGRY